MLWMADHVDRKDERTKYACGQGANRQDMQPKRDHFAAFTMAASTNLDRGMKAKASRAERTRSYRIAARRNPVKRRLFGRRSVLQTGWLRDAWISVMGI
jgi:hypothetical protein